MSRELNRRLWSLFDRGKVTHADIQEGLASIQAEYLIGETRRTEVPQPFGLASMVLPGAEIHSFFAGGDRDSPIGLALTDRRYAPLDLAAGETALYGKDVRTMPNRHWVQMTDKPKAGTIKVRGSRIELRAGQYYVLLDSDPAIGAQKGTFDPTQELPLDPHGAAL